MQHKRQQRLPSRIFGIDHLAHDGAVIAASDDHEIRHHMTVTASGGFGGNFEAQIESDHRVADADGWCTARVSMKQMTSLHATGASSPAELDVTPILHFTFWANVQLALSEITVDSGSAATP